MPPHGEPNSSVTDGPLREQPVAALRESPPPVNGDTVKPSHNVRPGDIVTIHTPGWDRVFKVVNPIAKRIGAKLAVEAYEDLSAPRPAYLSAPLARRDRGAGRPTKKDRREIDRLRGRDSHY